MRAPGLRSGACGRWAHTCRPAGLSLPWVRVRCLRPVRRHSLRRPAKDREVAGLRDTGNCRTDLRVVGDRGTGAAMEPAPGLCRSKPVGATTQLRPCAFPAIPRTLRRTLWTWPTFATPMATATWAAASQWRWTGPTSRAALNSGASGGSPKLRASPLTSPSEPVSLGWATRTWSSERPPSEWICVYRYSRHQSTARTSTCRWSRRCARYASRGGGL